MKRLSNMLGGLSVLLILSVLIAVFIFTFPQALRSSTEAQGESPYPGAPEQSYINPYPAPTGPPPESSGITSASEPTNLQPPIESVTPVVEEPSTLYQRPTPLPDLGVRASAPVEVTVSPVTIQGNNLPISGLFAPDLDGNLLAAKAQVQNDTLIVVIDVDTGDVEHFAQIADYNSEGPYIAGSLVSWVEPVSNTVSNLKQVQLLDLSTDLERTVWQGNLYQLDIKDEILVWQEERGQGWGINGYDLMHEQELIIAGGSGTFTWPRICSGEWVVYMHYSDSPEAGEVGTSDLFAHNLFTDETILIGQVPLSQSPTTGRSHDCDGNHVAWASWSWDTQTDQPVAQQHLYDLTTRTERLLNIPIEGWGIRVRIVGDILLSTVGYDLSRDVAFSPFANVPLEQTKGSGGAMISGNRLAWIARPGDAVEGPWHLYTAAIIRDN